MIPNRIGGVALIKLNMINEYIIKNNLTIKEFCKKCNISCSIYYKIVNNRCNFRLNALFKIARELKVNVWQIVNE